MRDIFVKDQYGKIKYERDDDWPNIVAEFSPSERVICAAAGQGLILQHRHRIGHSGKWSKWVGLPVETSHQQMRKLLERFHTSVTDNDNLDAICLKTDDGEYVEHNH
jgi:hypothetical protein